MNSGQTGSIRATNIRPHIAYRSLRRARGERLEATRSRSRRCRPGPAEIHRRSRACAHSRVGHDMTLGTQMSMTAWVQRPPEPAVDLTAGWSATPGTAADLTRLRHALPTLVRHRSGPAGADDGERLLLVFEELVSNALRHGRPPVRVVVAALRTGWLLDVSDAAADRPPVPAHDRDPATGGLGLLLVAALSAAHGWTVDGDRKHIWARVDADSSARRSLTEVVPAPRRTPV